MKFYDKDGNTLAPGMKLMKGRGDLEGLYKMIMESLVDMENEVIDIQFSENGDMAYMIPSYHTVLQEEEGTHDDIGKFLGVLTKKTGERTLSVLLHLLGPASLDHSEPVQAHNLRDVPVRVAVPDQAPCDVAELPRVLQALDVIEALG